MSFLDNLGKTVSQGVDRAKFEAEKFQKTNRLQGKVNHLKQQLDDKMIELGQRAYDLQRAGQIAAPSIASMAQTVDQLRGELIRSEEDLKAAQAETFTGVTSPEQASPPVQSVPITHEPPAQAPPDAAPAASQPAAGKKGCPNCSFQMPMHAVFCPNCGLRVG